MKKIFRIVLFSFICLNFLGCATVYNPVTQREELTLINTQTERALGQNIANQIEREYNMVQDPAILSRVRDIGNSIAVHSGRRDINYRFNVIDEDIVNAIALPGGYVYIFRGLLDEANDQELANVIAHEIAHIEARHSVKRLQTVLGYSLLVNIAFRGDSYANLVRYSNLAFDLIMRGYSRQDEYEADRVGMRLAYKAGYDPQGMINFLKKLEELDEFSDYQIEFLSTHPSYDNRISSLQEEIRKIKGE